MVDWGSCMIERSSLTVSSFRSRASKILLLVGSARAVICPKRAVGVKRSIRSSGLKVISLAEGSQVLFSRTRARIFSPMISRPLLIGFGLVLGSACVRHPRTAQVLEECKNRSSCTVVLKCDSQSCMVSQARPGPAATIVASEIDWPFYGRTASGDRHSPLHQIDASNVSQLQVAWRF